MPTIYLIGIDEGAPLNIDSYLSLKDEVFNFKARAITTIVALITLVSFAIPVLVTNAFAAGPAVVAIDAKLTLVGDGSAPFSPVDPSADNGLVATMDIASYKFDVSFNTLDAQTHSVKNVKLVGTLNSSSSDVRWMLNTLPSACVQKSVSADGKTVTCGLSQSFNTGTALNVSVGYFAGSTVPNNTDVTASFTAEATMDANPNSVDNPAKVTSNLDTLSVVSQGSQYEARKGITNTSAKLVRDANGNPDYLEVDWGVQAEVKSPTPNLLKGVTTQGLSTLRLKDLMSAGAADQQQLQSKGTFVGCLPVTQALDSSRLANSKASTFGDFQSVEDSGTWNCAQPSGTGGEINIDASGIKWSPGWFPHGKSGVRDQYYSFNNAGNIQNDIYNNPVGKNNQAVVATQIVRVRYPYADVVAFDQSAGDKDNRPDRISWCNEIGNVSVDGGPSGVDDPSNNSACVNFDNITSIGPLTLKKFVKYGGNAGDWGPETELGLSQGVLGTGASDNYLAAGMKFDLMNSTENNAASVKPFSNWNTCDVFQNQKYKLIESAGVTPPSNAIDYQKHQYYSWYSYANNLAPGFPAITDADVQVQFAASGTTFDTSTQMRTYNCDNPSLEWKSNPNDLAGGINSANLIRIRVINGKKIPPGFVLVVRNSVQSRSDLDKGDMLLNFAQFKTPEYISGNWFTARPACVPEKNPWNATSGTYGCAALADRMYVIAPTPATQISDTPNSPETDLPVSLSPGQTRKFTVQSGMGFNATVNVEGVHVYVTLPPGLDLQSSSLTPSADIADCKAFANVSCLTDENARTDLGYHTLVYNRGDFTFNYTKNDTTPQMDRTLFGKFDITVRLASYVPNAANLQLVAWTQADKGMESLDYPIVPRNTQEPFNDLISGPMNDDWITVATAQAFAIDKYVVDEQIPINGTIKYNLALGNLTGGAKVADAIDILPYNGDGRSPASAIDGGYRLSEIVDTYSMIDTVYITSDDPTTLKSDPKDASNPPVGTGKWSCTYAQAGTSGCPDKDEITAIRIITNSMGAGKYGQIQIQLETFGNNGQEVYTNNFQARATTLALPVISSDVTAYTPACISVGNLVFDDVNKNGKFDSEDKGVEGVDVTLKDKDNNEVGKTTTDADGRWIIECVAPGEYYAALDAAQFDDGNVLNGYVPAPDGVTTPSNRVDEDEDHNLLNINGVYRTNLFELGYDGPTGEVGNHPGDDKFDDLTIDLGVAVGQPDEPNPPDEPQVGGETLERGDNLPYTGIGLTLFTIGIFLVALGKTLWGSTKLFKRKHS